MENVVCIFAHPDDEALGPSGTITKWAKSKNVYIICVTDGENPNADTHSTFSIRGKEIKKSAKVMGVKKVFFLGYPDGELCNNKYHKVASDIQKILDKFKPETILTYELRGISGHIDHVFVSMVCTYLYQKLSYIKKIFYYAESKVVSDMMGKRYFIYFPDGYNPEDVDYIENVKDTMDTKIKAVKQHVSQKKDVDMILKKLKILPKEELFFFKQKGVRTSIKNGTKIAKHISFSLARKLQVR